MFCRAFVGALALGLAGCPANGTEPGSETDASAGLDAAVADAESSRDGSADTSPVDGSADGGRAPVPCNVVAPTSCPSTPPRYGDVQPIFTARCSSCHGKDWTGAWPLDTYSHIADWYDVVQAELVTCNMPPPDAAVPLSDAERTTILTWIRCDLPR